MDGTTVGQPGFAAPLPQPEAVGGGNLSIDHTASVRPSTSIPVPQAVPAQPQYSQLTPVYAPGPTNTVADIPQPLVKGIEFVTAPTQTQVPIEAEPLPSIAPVTMPSPVPPRPQAAQLIQPILPPLPPLVQPSAPITPAATGATTVPPAAQSPNENTIQKIENKIEDVDLDQMVGAAVATTVNNPAPQLPPSKTEVDTANYFQSKPQGDIVITNNAQRFSLPGINGKTIRLIAIIVIVIALAIGGYFIAKALIGGQKANQTSSTAKSQAAPVVAQTASTETSQSETNSASATDTSTSTSTTSTPATDTTTPATTASSTSDTSDTTPSTPAVANTGLEW